MPLVKETDYLVPTGGFLASFLVFVALCVLLVVWPFYSALRHQQWGWVLAVVLLAPLGGFLWFAVGRKDTPIPVSV